MEGAGMAVVGTEEEVVAADTAEEEVGNQL